jgi:hypothetical protein
MNERQHSNPALREVVLPNRNAGGDRAVDPATAPTQCGIATPLGILELRQETFGSGDCYLFMTRPIHRQSRRHGKIVQQEKQ